MEFDANLCNAAVIGENPEMSFIVEGKRLHAAQPRIAKLKKDACKPEQVLPLMREALKNLITFAKGKVPPHFTDLDKIVSLKPNERDQLIEKSREYLYSSSSSYSN